MLSLLVLCLLSFTQIQGYFIHIDAHAEECFFDKVTSGTKMSLMFEVAEGGFLDIDVKVTTYYLTTIGILQRSSVYAAVLCFALYILEPKPLTFII